MIFSMPSPYDSSPLAMTNSTVGVRRTGRLRCDMLSSTYGDVVDLSSAGMRVRHKGSLKLKVDEETTLTLAFTSAEVTLKARLVWMRRTGFRRCELGFEFLDVDPESRECLLEIARCATKLAGFQTEAA